MARRNASIGGRLTLNNAQYIASIGQAIAANLRYQASVGRMNGVTLGGGGAAGRWTELSSKITLVSGALRATAGAAIKADLSVESLVARIASVSDGTESVNKQIEELLKLSEKPGLNFQSAASGSSMLQTGGLMSPAESRKAVETMSNAAVLAGATAEDTERIMINVKQLMSGGGDLQDIKEVARVIPQFRDIADSLADLRAKDPKAFMRAVIERLQELPKAAKTARDSVDKMRDQMQKFMVERSGGRIMGTVGHLADTATNLLRGEGIAAGESFVNAGDALKGEGPTAVEKFELSPAETARRKQAAKDAADTAKRIAAEAAAKRESDLSAEFSRLNDVAELESDIAEARRKGDLDAVAALEDRRDILKESAALAEKMGVSQAFTDNLIRTQNAKQRDREALDRERSGKTAAGDAQRNLEISKLRMGGTSANKRADRMEADKTEADRVKQLTGEGVGEKQAREIASGERDVSERQAYQQRTGRRRIAGARSSNKRGGLEELKALQDEGGGSAIDRNKAELDKSFADRAAAAQNPLGLQPIKFPDASQSVSAPAPQPMDPNAIQILRQQVEKLDTLASTIRDYLLPKSNAAA